jgi:NhaP-type Na+/H+ or K+/H+ antiporter
MDGVTVDHVAILTAAFGFLVLGLVSRRIQGSVLTGPMLFAGFGLLVGPAVLGLVPVKITNTALHFLAEITLVLVLFSDAASIDLRQLRRDHNLPVRMLAVGMPLSILMSLSLALLLFTEFTIWEAALLAAILAPTDAALGQSVVTNRLVPVRIRQALNVESGLNDGIALPLVLVFAALASASEEAADAPHWILFMVKQITFGPLAGIAVGYLGAKLVALCYRTKWLTETAEGIIALALAFCAFALAEVFHGNGFIAAFVAGLTFGNTLGTMCRYLYEFAETEGQILILLTFMAFGSAMIPVALPDAAGIHLIFALLTLTLMRMIPIAVSLLGSGVQPVTTAFLGWFGPRGLASVLFTLLILERVEFAHKHDVFIVVIVTVTLSILLHGLTAGPAARWYGAKAEAMGTCEENQPVPQEPFSDSRTLVRQMES